ncbi:MAG: insulinase family protein [Bacilli bacterium]|jgi:hypothetical protein|nr:insulinase family protein [Bacilli bacterium]
MQKVTYDKVDKVLYQAVLESGLKVVCAPLAFAKEAIIGLYCSVGGYAREFTIGNQKILPGTPGLLAEALLAYPGKKGAELLKKGNGKISYRLEESYTSYEYKCKEEEVLSSLDDFLSIFDSLDCDNDQTEKLKGKYLERIKKESVKAEDKVRPLLYSASPMGQNPYGDEDDLKGVHLVALKKFFNEFYDEPDLTLFVVGNVKPEEVEKIARAHVFPKRDNDKEVEVKAFKEDYQNLPVLEQKGEKGKLVLAVKFPPRKTLFDEFGENVFSYYEMLIPVLFSANNKNAQPVLALGKPGFGIIKQGGEDAYLYQEFETAKPAEMKDEILKLFKNPKMISFFDYRKARKEYLNSRKKVFKEDLDGYYFALTEALANSFAAPALVETGVRVSKRKFLKFVSEFVLFPSLFIIGE